MALYLFDMDGTILHLRLEQGKLDELRRQMFAAISSAIGDPGTMSIFGMYRAVVSNPNANPDLIARLRSMIDEIELSAIGSYVIHESMPFILRQLKASSAQLGLVTNNGRAVVTRILALEQMDQLFDVTVCRDDVSDLKPSPAPLLHAIAALNPQTEHGIFFIGDSAADEESANAFNKVSGHSLRFQHIDHFLHTFKNSGHGE
jgi:HAD superfamily hydrolase (TIGR01549 family)